MKRIMVKIGGLKHLGEERWRDALNVFDEVHCVACFKELNWKIQDERIIYHVMPETFLNRCLIALMQRSKRYKAFGVFCDICILLFRVMNREWLKTLIAIPSEFILCSYGDYDYSDMMLLLTRGYISGNVVRSLKETRKEYNHLEYKAIKYAETISLYCRELKTFIEEKYGACIFENKRMLLGMDENVLPTHILNGIEYNAKLSDVDGKVHVALLTYRADSMPIRERDQSRYYYIDLIKELIRHGYVVHMHCKQFNDYEGNNFYKELESVSNGNFIIERPLEMRKDSSTKEWIGSCEELSKYDAGMLHNIADSGTVSEFDKINVPHRYFAYEAAHVVPLIRRGQNKVLERMFSEEHRGFIFNSYAEIAEILNEQFEFDCHNYKDYLTFLYDSCTRVS